MLPLLWPTLNNYVFALRSIYVIHAVWYYPFRTFYFLLLLLYDLWPLLWLLSCDLWQCDSDVTPTLTPVPRKEKKSQKKLRFKLHKSDNWSHPTQWSTLFRAQRSLASTSFIIQFSSNLSDQFGVVRRNSKQGYYDVNAISLKNSKV